MELTNEETRGIIMSQRTLTCVSAEPLTPYPPITDEDKRWLLFFKMRRAANSDPQATLSLFFENPPSPICSSTIRWRRRKRAKIDGVPCHGILPSQWKRLEPIVVSLVQRYALPSNSRADLLQAGWLGAARALSTWKKDGGSSLETWAFLLIRKAVTTARAKEMTLSGIGPAAWRNHGADLYCTEMPVDDLSMSPCPSPCATICTMSGPSGTGPS